ncbi:hypothetical protein AYI70_g1249 [Smittium culicis]|uniref:Uncharacterized protein n=1 Tax=Smittium culicis TaxID=133412 RepID=A0A1R1YDD9_9FUNG|nr:hypothetical protein AYI70_g1249 [Smittium culicis]
MRCQLNGAVLYELISTAAHAESTQTRKKAGFRQHWMVFKIQEPRLVKTLKRCKAAIAEIHYMRLDPINNIAFPSMLNISLFYTLSNWALIFPSSHNYCSFIQLATTSPTSPHKHCKHTPLVFILKLHSLHSCHPLLIF